jgi:hypothetical protein
MERAGFTLVYGGKVNPWLGHDEFGLQTPTGKGCWVELDPNTDAIAYVVSRNIYRRHLTAEQKRELIANLLKATPEKSDRQIAKTVKVDHKTVASVRAEKEGRGEIPHVAKRQDAKGRQQPARKTPTKPTPRVSDEVLQRRDAAAQRFW